MKLLLYSDPHWSQYSSILRKRGTKYSYRLENEIASINWCQRLAEYVGCDRIICLGDFFDKESLNSEEIAALQDIEWSYIPNDFIVGNHEMGINTLEFSSSHIFKIINATVVDKPVKKIYTQDIDTEICYLPYVLNDKRKSICEYFGEKSTKRRIILSHNDIKGIQMGAFISKDGFEINDIESNCDKFINGHLHNGSKISDKIFNIGNLTGQNFSENALIYNHSVFVIDTETLIIEVYDNPYSLNFYKIDCIKEDGMLMSFKSNSIVSVRCSREQLDIVNESLKDRNILESRVVVQVEKEDKDKIQSNIDSLSIDHINEFRKYILSIMNKSDELEYELNEVAK